MKTKNNFWFLTVFTAVLLVSDFVLAASIKIPSLAFSENKSENYQGPNCTINRTYVAKMANAPQGTCVVSSPVLLPSGTQVTGIEVQYVNKSNNAGCEMDTWSISCERDAWPIVCLPNSVGCESDPSCVACNNDTWPIAQRPAVIAAALGLAYSPNATSTNLTFTEALPYTLNSTVRPHVVLHISGNASAGSCNVAGVKLIYQ